MLKRVKIILAILHLISISGHTYICLPVIPPPPSSYILLPKIAKKMFFLRANMRFIQLFMWDIAGKKWIDSYTSKTYSALKCSSEMCFRKTSCELQFEDQGCIWLQRPRGIVVNTKVTNQLNMFPFQYFFSYCLLNFESSGICFVWKSAGSPDKSRSCPKVLR